MLRGIKEEVFCLRGREENLKERETYLEKNSEKVLNLKSHEKCAFPAGEPLFLRAGSLLL